MAAFMPQEVHAALARAASSEFMKVTILTSRPVMEVWHLAGFDSHPIPLDIVGLCGAERMGADGSYRLDSRPSVWAEAREGVRRVLHGLGIEESVPVEEKQTAITIHYRGSDLTAEQLSRLERDLSYMAKNLEWSWDSGKAVIELRPKSLNKGAALSEILGRVAVTTAVYAGDDRVDSAAFRALEEWKRQGFGRQSIGVLIEDDETGQAMGPVDVKLSGPSELAGWIVELTDGVSDVRGGSPFHLRRLTGD